MDAFDTQSLKRIIDLHNRHIHLPLASALELYESDDAVMWDGYNADIQALHDEIDNAFRFNANIEAVDASLARSEAGLANLNLAQIAYLFRDILVNEKFHQGLFADCIVEGRITRLMHRLSQLV